MAEVLIHTLDGIAGAGKGTVAPDALDTGQIYRAATELFLRTDSVNRELGKEHLAYATETILEDERRLAEFAVRVRENVVVAEDGLYLEDEKLEPQTAHRLLYADPINNAISVIASKPEIRAHCDDLSVQFVERAREAGVDHVYLDGRAEAQAVKRALETGRLRVDVGRLALTAFLTVEEVEAAHRTLHRDSQGHIPYRTLRRGDETLEERIGSITSRNRRDSTREIDPVVPTKIHYDAWKDVRDDSALDGVIGGGQVGGELRHVRFDTTYSTPAETIEMFELWREAITERIRQPLGATIVSRG